VTRSRPQTGVAGQLTDVLTALKGRMAENLVSVVLFGSRARGEAGVESDWDLLVVARQLPQRTLERHFQSKMMLPEKWRGRIALLVKTPEEFENRLPSLYLDIALDGIVLYDTGNYMSERLAQLKRLIERKGLRRDQEMAWRWKRFPGPDWSLEWEAAR